MHRPLALAAVTVLFAAACSDDDGGQSSDSTIGASTAATSSTAAPESTVVTSSTDAAATTAGPTSAPATTEPAPTTAPTVPPTAAPSPPTTAAAQPAALALMSTGIGSVAFGTPETEALATFESALGPVSSEIANSYPNDLGDGTYLDEAGVDAFVHRAHRTACFDNALCVVFGGDAPGALEFVGWVQNNQGVDAPLATASGITAGSTWADHVDAIEVAEFGCYTVGYGTTEGIRLTLTSVGEPFTSFDDAGNAVATRPDPGDVSVIELAAGDHPFFIGEDC
jgi:hypothetical protein